MKIIKNCLPSNTILRCKINLLCRYFILELIRMISKFQNIISATDGLLDPSMKMGASTLNIHKYFSEKNAKT